MGGFFGDPLSAADEVEGPGAGGPVWVNEKVSDEGRRRVFDEEELPMRA